MAFTSGLVVRVITGGSDASTGSGGGFDTGVTAGMATDGAATSGNTSAPVFTSASYNFVAGDVGAWLYIAAGTNWIPGWYQIVSVAANAATLAAGIGVATLPTNGLNTVAGVATTGSPTGATWSVDYSQQAGTQLTYTDLVIGAGNTTATSVAHPFTVNQVGNLFSVSSGTGFTVQRVALVSVAAGVGTFDKALGTAASTGGNAKMGGAFASIGMAGSLNNTGVRTWVKYNATPYSNTGGTANITNGRWSTTSGTTISPCFIRGYDVTPGDETANRPTLKWGVAGGAQSMLTFSTTGIGENLIVDGNVPTVSNTSGVKSNGGNVKLRRVKIMNCDATAFLEQSNTSLALLIDVEITGCSTLATINHGSTGVLTMVGCSVHDNTIDGLTAGSGVGPARLVMYRCLFANNKSGATKSHLILGTTNFDTHVLISGCAFYGSGSHAIDMQTNNVLTVLSSVFENSGGWAINTAAAGRHGQTLLMNNGFYNNTSGNYDTTKVLGMDAVGNFNGLGSFFVNPAGNNYALNTLASRGAAAIRQGYPNTWGGNSSVSYLDSGALQHQSESSSVGSF